MNILVAWSPRSRPDVAETYVEVRQSGLDELGGLAAIALAAQLLASGVRFSRADGYYDDRARHAEPATVADAFRRGDVLTHIRHFQEIRGFVTDGPDGTAIPSGATTYLGSAKSETRVRVYDKAAESRRPDAGIRWELQLRGKHAARFVDGAVRAREQLGSHVLACIRGLADFRDRSGHERGDRAPLLDWWAAIVGDAERVRLSGPARVDVLADKAAWLDRQAAPTLALCHFAYGPDWLDGLLREGERRLTDSDWKLLGPQYARQRGTS
jgi:hypothetical protein